MNRCLQCGHKLGPGDKGYHARCALALFGRREPPTLPYTWSDLNEVAEKIVKRSIAVPGVQPKLSMHIERNRSGPPGRFTLVGLEGDFILKPPSVSYPEMPELEHACMRLAAHAGVETASCGLISLASGERAYITRRMDRDKGRVLHMEDMCQLTDKLTEQKYRGSVEQVGKVVLAHTTHSGFDALRVYELTLFCFLTGNADMHLKNFSLLYELEGRIRLSPAYDLLPTRLLLPQDQEEMALTVNGKKNRLSRRDFDALGESLALTRRQIENANKRLFGRMANAASVLDAAFVSSEKQNAFLQLIGDRLARMG